MKRSDVPGSSSRPSSPPVRMDIFTKDNSSKQSSSGLLRSSVGKEEATDPRGIADEAKVAQKNADQVTGNSVSSNSNLIQDFGDETEDGGLQLDDASKELVPLFPTKEEIDHYNDSQNWSNLIRYTFRDPFINRYKIIPYAACCTNRSNNFRRQWLEGRAVELNERDINFQRNTEYYLNGKALFMKKLWPLTLLGMMIYDGIQLARFPDLSFGNTSLDIFAGFSPNSLSIATNIGSDIAAEFSYWCGFAILVAGPVIFGVGNIALHRRWSVTDPIAGIDPRDAAIVTAIPSEDEIEEYTAANHRMEEGGILDVYQALLKDSPAPKHLSWLNPFSQRRQLLDYAVTYLLYQSDRDEMIIRSNTGKWYQYHPAEAYANYDHSTIMTKSQFLLSCIRRLASLSPSLAQQYAYLALAAIVDKLTGYVEINQPDPLFPRSSEKIVDLGEGAALVSPPSAKSKLELRQTAFFDLLRPNVRANYQLWTTGYKGFSKLYRLLFGAYAGIKNLWLLYAYYRYFLFIVRKIIGGVQFLVAKADCEKNGKLYLYDPDIGNYDCTICGDWPTVFDTHSSQGCLAGILESSNNADEINSALARVRRFTTNFTEINLVGQNWITWSELQFNQFVGNLSSMTAIGTFNASRIVYNIVFPQDTNKIVELAELNNLTCVSRWDFTNQRIGDAIMPFLDSMENNPCVREFYVSGNALADQNMRKLADIVNTTKIDTLVLDHNNLSGDVLDYFSGQVPPGLLRVISIRNNFLGQTGLNAMGKLIAQNPNLGQLALGNNDFSGLDFSGFGTALQRGYVQSLSLNGCSLGSDEIAELAPYLNTTQSINIADNDGLNREAAQILMSSLQGAVTTELNLRGIPMDNFTIQALGDGLQGTNIESIDVSDSQVKGDDFVSFLSKLKGTKVHRLKASDNLFGPDICQQIADAITQQGLIFIEFDLSTNNMGDQAGANLVNALTGNNTNISLHLNNNSLGQLTAIVLKEKIAASRVVGLEVNSNQFSSADLDAISLALPNSALQSFSYRDNGKVLDGSVETNIALQLLKDIPDQADIVNDPPSRDLARWIHSKGLPQTSISSINSQDNKVALPGARALCNVMKPAKLKPNDVLISTKGFNPTANPCFFNRNNQSISGLQLPAVRNIPASEAPNNSMMMVALGIPLIGLVLFAVLLYKWLNSPREENLEKNEKRKNFQP